jgi:hypothetical protein
VQPPKSISALLMPKLAWCETANIPIFLTLMYQLKLIDVKKEIVPPIEAGPLMIVSIILYFVKKIKTTLGLTIKVYDLK